MDKWRRGNERKSQPHNNERNKKGQAPIGFDGMNYEQKRKPYGESTSLERGRNRNHGDDIDMGNRMDER